MRHEVACSSNLTNWRAQLKRAGMLGLATKHPGPKPQHDDKDRQIEKQKVVAWGRNATFLTAKTPRIRGRIRISLRAIPLAALGSRCSRGRRSMLRILRGQAKRPALESTTRATSPLATPAIATCPTAPTRDACLESCRRAQRLRSSGRRSDSEPRTHQERCEASVRGGDTQCGQRGFRCRSRCGWLSSRSTRA